LTHLTVGYLSYAGACRELSLRKGDIVYLRRAIDDNWFEGEHHGLVGRFPVSYVEVALTKTVFSVLLTYCTLVKGLKVKRHV